MIDETVWFPQMSEFLRAVAKRLVVVGSVARTIRDPDFVLPKDIDLLCDIDSDRARKEIGEAIRLFHLRFESPFLASWTFRDYGWMVEILGIHRGPGFKAVRRRAEQMTIGGVKLWVARAEDAPR